MELHEEVSASKAGKITGTTAATIIRYCEKGAIPFRKRLTRRMIKLSDLKIFADSNGLTFDLNKM